MGELLIAAVVELGENGWPGRDPEASDLGDRIAASLALGKGGAVSLATAVGAVLAWRGAQHAAGAGRPLRSPVPRGDLLAVNGTYCLLAGRIDNRRELLGDLELPNDAPDNVIYAHAWHRHGEACDLQLIGDYAAILWVPQDRLLRLARSPMSRQPLHIWRQGSRIIAASSPRAIFAAGVPSQVDDRALADSLFLNFRDPNASRFAGLSRVGPGHVALHRPNGSDLRRYWSIDSVKPVRFARDRDYVEALDEQFQRATVAALVGVERPAILLSGGLDSQAVAAYTMGQLAPGQSLHSWTAVPAPHHRPAARLERFEDESAHVRALAERYPALRPEIFHIEPSEETLFRDQDTFVMLAAWPTLNEIATSWVGEACRRAQRSNCEVMLVGDMGNIGFSYGGEAAPASWLRRGRLLRLLQELRASRDPRGLPRRFWSQALKPNLPVALQAATDAPRGWTKPAFGWWNALHGDFARAHGVLERARDQGYDPHGYLPASSARWRAEVLSTFASEGAEIGLGLQLLHGLPLRDPTAYRPLVELCAGMPDEQFLHFGTDRWLARRLLDGKLPELVVEERRIGRQSADWPVHFNTARPALIAELHRFGRDPRLAQVIDFDALARDLADWPGTDVPQDAHTMRIAFRISRALAAARFVRHFERRNAG